MIRRTAGRVWRVSDVTERRGEAPRRESAWTAGFWKANLLSPYPFAAMATGAGVTALLSRGFPGVRGLAFGAWIGLTCYLLAILAERALYGVLWGLSGARAGLARALVFSLAGLSGFLVGQATGRSLFLGESFRLPTLDGGLGIAIGASAALAVL